MARLPDDIAEALATLDGDKLLDSWHEMLGSSRMIDLATPLVLDLVKYRSLNLAAALDLASKVEADLDFHPSTARAVDRRLTSALDSALVSSLNLATALISNIPDDAIYFRTLDPFRASSRAIRVADALGVSTNRTIQFGEAIDQYIDDVADAASTDRYPAALAVLLPNYQRLLVVALTISIDEEVPSNIASVGELATFSFNEQPALEQSKDVVAAAEVVMGRARHMYEADVFPADDGTAEHARATIESLDHALHPTTGEEPNPLAVEGLTQTLNRLIAAAEGASELVEVIDEMTSKGPDKGSVVAGDWLAEHLDSSNVPVDVENRDEVVKYIDEHPHETVAQALGWKERVSSAASTVQDSIDQLYKAGRLGGLVGVGAGAAVGGEVAATAALGGVGSAIGVVIGAIIALLANYRRATPKTGD